MSEKEIDEFVVHLCVLLASVDVVCNAMLQVIAHQLARDPLQRFLHGRDLHQDIRAVPVFLYHFGDPTYLSFDPLQAPQIAGLGFGVHRDCLSFLLHIDSIPPYPISVCVLRLLSYNERFKSFLKFSLGIFFSMTTVDVVFRYGTPPDERTAFAISRAREVYGIRKISFDEKENTVRVEYDATRLDANEVSNLLRSAGLDLRERIQIV
jgi:hypothetical protein